MPRSGLLAVVAAVPLAAAVWLGGQEEPLPPGSEAGTRARIVSLVGRLGSSERADRVAAERDLLDYGPWILPLLPASGDVPDPAARTALDRVRQRLEEAKAEEEVRASSVEFHGRGTVAEVMSEIYRSGLTFTPDQAGRTIALDSDETQFWPVVDDLARQAHLWPDRAGPFQELSFRERTPEDDAKRLAYAKAFRFAAGPVSVKPVAGEGARRLVRVPVEVRAEPKLRPLFLSYASADLTLTTAAGAALPPFTPEAKQELPFGETGGAVEPRLDFVAAGPIEGPLTLKGTVRLIVAAGREWFGGYLKGAKPVNGEELPAPRDATHGGVTVRVREATLNGDGTADVELAVLYEHGGPAFESHRMWVYHNEASLQYEIERDGAWESLRVDRDAGFATLAQADGGIVVRYRFSGIPPEARQVRFEYRAPTKIVEVPVEFKIDGLTVAAQGDAPAAPADPVNAGSAAGP